MVWSRWKMMAGVLSVSLGGLATVAGQCPKPDANKGSKAPVELAMATDVPAIPGPTLPESAAKAPPAAPAAPAAPTLPTPAVPAPQGFDIIPALPAGPGAPAMPPSPTLQLKGPEVPALPAPTVLPSPTVPAQEVHTRKHEEKPITPSLPPVVAPDVVPASGALLPPAPSNEPSKPAAPTTPTLPHSGPPIGFEALSGGVGATPPVPVEPPVGLPTTVKPATPPAPRNPAVPVFAGTGLTPPPPVATSVIQPVTPAQPAPAVVAASGVSLSTMKFRIVLRVGEGEPTFEVRSGDDLMMKVMCEKVDIKSPEKGVGPSIVKATGKVRFTGFGAEGTCEELTFLAGTGEVDMAGQVKIHVKDKLGRVESELSTETMKYKLDPNATGAIKP